MSSEWIQTTWGELASLEYGKGIRGYQEAVAPYRVYGTNGPVGWHTEPLCNGAGVVIGRKGAYRGVHFSPAPFYVIDTAFYLRPKVAIDIRWAYYQLLTVEINGMDSGSAIPSTSRDEFYKIPVVVPPIHEQAAIAELLVRLDDRITLLRETNATLEDIAQALFKSWFVDFDPVRAKLDGRAPEGMDEATAALFPDSFEDSELGEVPRGWHTGSIASLMRLHKGAVNPGNAPEEWFQHFSLPAYDDGQTPVLQKGVEIKSNKTSVPASAVLLSKLNPHIPRVWLPSSINANAVCSTEFLTFVPTQVSTTNFVYSLLNAPDFCSRLCQLVTGTSNSHQRVKPDSVLCLPQVVPSPECIRAYDALVEGLYARLKLNREASRQLASLRDTLLPRLISGQLRLPELTQQATSMIA